MSEAHLLTIARIAHEADRAYLLSLGGTSPPTWDNARDWQQDSIIAGVKGVLNGSITEQSYESRLAQNTTLTPQLKNQIRLRDDLFIGVIKAAYDALIGVGRYVVIKAGTGLFWHGQAWGEGLDGAQRFVATEQIYPHMFDGDDMAVHQIQPSGATHYVYSLLII